MSNIIKPMLTKWYGWRPDIPDARDHQYKVARPRAALRTIFIHDTFQVPTIVDQGNLGSCTGNGWGRLLWFLTLNGHVKVPSKTLPPFSRLFIYYNERALEGTVNQDAGAMIRDGIRSIVKLGVCSEATWPYTISKFADKPPKKAYTEAKKFVALDYQRIDNTNKSAIVDCLASGFPIVHGFTVYDGFESAAVAKTGVVNMPDLKKEKVLGGHCTVIEGYDLKTDRFYCANSWGIDWGMKGYYTIPAAYLTNPNMADDFWTLRLIK